MNLEGKVAIITGASRGIGRAVAQALAREGLNLVLAARSKNELESLETELERSGCDVLSVEADLRQEADVRNLFRRSFEHFPNIDILINNVGVGKYGTVSSLSVQDYDWMMNSNMRSSFLCTHAILPHLLERNQGSIIFIGSVAGLRGLPQEAVYCASKFAQTGFAQALDHEVREHGIKVSLIAPGGVHTHFAIGTGREAGDPGLDAMLDAEDVAEAVLFALKQPEKSRVFLIGMRPHSEAL